MEQYFQVNIVQIFLMFIELSWKQLCINWYTECSVILYCISLQTEFTLWNFKIKYSFLYFNNFKKGKQWKVISVYFIIHGLGCYEGDLPPSDIKCGDTLSSILYQNIIHLHYTPPCIMWKSVNLTEKLHSKTRHYP